jgi:hypothetical protein
VLRFTTFNLHKCSIPCGNSFVNTEQQPGLGGMWTPEGMWELDGVRATMSDGGYGSQIRADGFSAWMQYSGGAADHTVHFSEGVRDDLVALAVKVSKAKFAADDELKHTGD